MFEFFCGLFFGVFFLAIAPDNVRARIVEHFDLYSEYKKRIALEQSKTEDKK